MLHPQYAITTRRDVFRRGKHASPLTAHRTTKFPISLSLLTKSASDSLPVAPSVIPGAGAAGYRQTKCLFARKFRPTEPPSVMQRLISESFQHLFLSYFRETPLLLFIESHQQRHNHNFIIPICEPVG
jgi:hypothetical protein